MTEHPKRSQPILKSGQFPDRKAPPSRLKDHGLRQSDAPSAAQRLLLASRVRQTLDQGLSKWSQSQTMKPPDAA